ncbi:MAG: gliding motility lipoprotein GldH [Muribaculaceae bacterium]|nr:gliding motility lipoprotein GldH [Muribaculaceae bacterium]
MYSDFVDIPANGWPYDEFCEFNTAELDSTLFMHNDASYDVIISVRHTDQYPYTSLVMSDVQSIDDSTSLPDTLTLNLMDSKNKWLGSCSKGIYTFTDTILRNTKLPPSYSLRLFHAMPTNPLPGLLSIGLIIEKR